MTTANQLLLKFTPSLKKTHTTEGITTATTCTTCHSSTSIPNTTATPKTATHIATTYNCGSCHILTAWKPATYTHAPSDTNCLTCHNGTIATAKPASHTLAGQCSACHTQTNWTTLTYKTTYVHTNSLIVVSATKSHPSITSCSKCHSSTTDSVKWTYTKVSTTVPKSTIIPTGTCAGCHLDKYYSQHGTLTKASDGNCLTCHHHDGYPGF